MCRFFRFINNRLWCSFISLCCYPLYQMPQLPNFTTIGTWRHNSNSTVSTCYSSLLFFVFFIRYVFSFYWCCIPLAALTLPFFHNVNCCCILSLPYLLYCYLYLVLLCICIIHYLLFLFALIPLASIRLRLAVWVWWVHS